MVCQQTKLGVTSALTADLYYHPNGRLVTHFNSPNEYIVENSPTGKATVYNPKLRTVFEVSNPFFSAETCFFQLFMQKQQHDLGLSVLGFTHLASQQSGPQTLSRWRAPAHLAKFVHEVELVHIDTKPVLMLRLDIKKRIYQKTYFVNYKAWGTTELPTELVQVDYISDKDSVITRTQFSDLGNTSLANGYFNFKIPTGAKVVR